MLPALGPSGRADRAMLAARRDPRLAIARSWRQPRMARGAAGYRARVDAAGSPEGMWKPRAMPPLGVDLDERQKLACLHRILAGIGFNENMAGHVTMADPASDHLWASPWGMWWDEVRASDLCLVAAGGEVLDGPWDVSPAIFLHTELHKARPDARVVVHNHPYHATLLATLGRLP